MMLKYFQHKLLDIDCNVDEETVRGLKVSTTCRKDNPDANIPTALAFSSTVIRPSQVVFI